MAEATNDNCYRSQCNKLHYCSSERHPFNGLSSTTIWVSQHQKAYINLDFNEAREYGMAVASAGPYANLLHLTPNR